MRKRLLRFVVVLSALLVLLSFMTGRERGRMERTATEPATSPLRGPISGEEVHQDVGRLSAPEFEGRHTGTAGSRRAQDFVIERFRAAGVAPAFGDSYRQPFAFTRASIRGVLSGRPYRTAYPEAANVGGLVRGTERPERYLALSAHYDHFGIRDGELFPGADDNASGVAVMLAVGRLLARQPPRHTILLLAWDAEELGLRGARHFVADPPVELQRIETLINLDMVGRGDRNVLVAAGTSHHPRLEAPIRAAATSRGLRVVFGHDRPLYKAGRVADWTHSSDHGPFHDAGVPFIYFGVEDHADYHRPTDTVEKIPPEFLGEVASLVYDLLRRLDAGDGVR